jgi:hypothetical protein
MPSRCAAARPCRAGLVVAGRAWAWLLQRPTGHRARAALAGRRVLSGAPSRRTAPPAHRNHGRVASAGVTPPARGGPTRRRRHPKERWPQVGVAAPPRQQPQGSASPRRDRFDLAATIRPQQPHPHPRHRHRQRRIRARNDGDPEADAPPMISRMAASRGKTRARTLASPNSTQPSAKTPNDMVRPASSRPVGVSTSSAGACSAAYGTAKASNHQ